MYRSILIPLDGSRFGEQAIPYARMLAGRSGARIRLVHAHEPVYLEAMIDTRLDLQLRRQAGQYLASVAERLSRQGVEVSTKLLIGRPSQWIGRYIEKTAPDLVVMTTHGRGGIERFWLGSLTDTVLRRSRIPVLAIRPVRGGRARRAEPRIRRILVPLDGSRLAEQILRPASRLAAMTGADFDLLSVVMPPFSVGAPHMAYSVHVDEARLAESVEEARRYLDHVARKLELRGHGIGTAEVLVGAEIAPMILRHAAELDAEAVAIATHGRGGLRRLLLGSTADKLIRGSRIPVLVYRPPE